MLLLRVLFIATAAVVVLANVVALGARVVAAVLFLLLLLFLVHAVVLAATVLTKNIYVPFSALLIGTYSQRQMTCYMVMQSCS